MPERFLTLTIPGSDTMTEVEIDHWFRRGAQRFAVVYRLHNGHQPLFWVRAESELHPVPDDHESEWEDER